MSSGEGDSKQQAAVQLCCEVMVELSTDHMIKDVLLTVDADQPLAVHPCIFRWAKIGVCVCAVYRWDETGCRKIDASYKKYYEITA